MERTMENTCQSEARKEDLIGSFLYSGNSSIVKALRTYDREAMKALGDISLSL